MNNDLFVQKVKIKVCVRAWGARHVVDPEVIGGDKKLLDKKIFTKSGVRLMDREILDEIHKVGEKMRGVPGVFGAKPEKDTGGTYELKQRALPDFKAFWDERIGEYNNLVNQFVKTFPNRRNAWLKNKILPHLETVAAKKGYDEAWVKRVLADIREAYPDPGTIKNRFKVYYKPVGDMALYPTSDGKGFIDDLDKQGAKMRDRMIAFAKLDEAAQEAGYRKAYFSQLAKYGAKFAKQAKEEKFIGQTMRSMRLFLHRASITASDEDTKLIPLLEQLRDLIPEEDYTAMRNNGISAKILNMLDKIKKITVTGMKAAIVAQKTLNKAKRKVEIF